MLVPASCCGTYIFHSGWCRFENIGHCHSLRSLHLRLAALPSLPGISPPVRFLMKTKTSRIPRRGILDVGAGNRNRTGTDFTPRDFKSLVSTYSTMPAGAIILPHFLAIVKSNTGDGTGKAKV